MVGMRVRIPPDLYTPPCCVSLEAVVVGTKDAIMLGDNGVALAQMADFEKMMKEIVTGR